MKTYTITSGLFRMDDGSLRQAGDTIELPDDVAALHATQLQATASPLLPSADAAPTHDLA